MNYPQKLNLIKSIRDERKLHELLRDLFLSMGYNGVSITHGPDEDGKDLVMYEVSKIKEREFKAVVVKIGDITGATTVKSEGSIANVEQQIRECFTIPYDDLESHQSVNIRSVYVVTNGNISNRARKKITSSFAKQGGLSVNVDFINLEKLVKLIEENYPSYFLYGDSFVSRYFSKLKLRLEKMEDMQTFEYKGESKKLDDIYIEPALRPSKDHGKRLLPAEALTTSNNILLIGISGSGKTTLMKHLILEQIDACALKLGKRSLPNLSLSDLNLPIHFRFRDLINSKTLVENIEVELAFEKNSATVFDLRDHLLRGLITVFVDSLDEVTDSNDKDMVIEKVASFAAQFPTVKIVISSREIEYLAVNPGLVSFKRFEILPLDGLQIERFVRRWFKNKHLDMERMLKALRDTVMFEKLQKTPLVLTLLSILLEQGERKELPSTMSELYSLATELFLKRWDVEKNIESLYEYPAKEYFLTEFAYSLHSSSLEEYTPEQMIQFTASFIQRLNLEFKAEEFLTEVVERTQLVARNERGNYQFKHLSFQDFFAAKAYREKGGAASEIVRNFSNIQWEGVIFFYCGLKKVCPEIFDDIMSTWSTDGFTDHLRKIFLLGYITQAAFLNPFETKKKTVAFGVEKTYELLNMLIESPPDDLKELVKRIPPNDLLHRFKLLFATHFGSIVLNRALESIYESIALPLSTNDPVAAELFKKKATMKYYLAYALAEMNRPEYLQRFLIEGPRGDVGWLNAIKQDIGDLQKASASSHTKSALHEKMKKTISKHLARIDKSKRKSKRQLGHKKRSNH